MADTRTVQQGDHISSIAAQAGFADFHSILNQPDNSDLAGKRDGHVLFPGDQLAIPDRDDRTEFGDTGASYTYQTDLRPLYLRCEILDINGKPVKSANCNIAIDKTPVPDLTTDGAGILLQPIGRQDKAATVTVHLPATPSAPANGDSTGNGQPADPPPDITLPFDVKLGYLNPETKLSGQQARLNNLGYFAGFTLKDLEQLLWAAEEFECDHMVKPVKARPEFVPAPPGGEDDASGSDPDSKTGIQDSTIVAKLKSVHGI